MNFTLPPFLMKRSKKELIQLGFTAVLMIIFFVVIIQGAAKQNAKKSKMTNVKPVIPAPQEKVRQKALLQKLNQEIKTLKIGRDPFNPAPREIPHDLLLNGIVWDKENSLAVINDTIVKIGSTIDGNTVIDISENGVTLSKDQETFKLELKFPYAP